MLERDPPATVGDLLEFDELKLGSEAAVWTIVKRAKLRAREVVLDIARVPVVGDVEDGEAHSSFA